MIGRTVGLTVAGAVALETSKRVVILSTVGAVGTEQLDTVLRLT